MEAALLTVEKLPVSLALARYLGFYGASPGYHYYSIMLTNYQMQFNIVLYGVFSVALLIIQCCQINSTSLLR